MTNTKAIFISLLARLTAVEYTHDYIMGFTFGGLVYSYNTNQLTTGVELNTVSGGGYRLRYRPKSDEKKALIASGICTIVCTEKYLADMVANSKYNKGENFEKLITEKMGLTWEKDSVRLDKGADIEVNGKAYSVKFENATIVTEKTLVNIESGR